MSSSADETSPLVHSSSDNKTVKYYSESAEIAGECPDTNFEPQVYRIRWWILFVFCMFVINQSCCYVIWMPLSDALLIAYEWDVSEIGMAGAVTCLAFLISALPIMYVIEKRGIRIGVLIANTSLVVASTFWTISLFTHEFWLFTIGAIFNGIAPTVGVVLPSLLSVTWFPVSQRTTATSICVLSISVGFMVGFVAGPQISGAHVTADDVINRSNLTAGYVDDLTQGLQHVAFFLGGLNIFGLLLIIAYFPSAPPTQPSVSQTVKREDFLPGLKVLLKNSQYLILCVAFLASNAIATTWLPLISVTFRPLGISEVTASWMGTSSTLAGSIFIIVISVISDRHYFKRKTKFFLKVFSGSSIVLLLLLGLIQIEVISLSENVLVPTLYTLVILIVLCGPCLVPLYLELSCEYAFPVYEGLACAVLMLGNWSISLLFYMLLLIPALSEATGWMTWTCLAGSCVNLPLLILLKDGFSRLNLDERN